MIKLVLSVSLSVIFICGVLGAIHLSVGQITPIPTSAPKPGPTFTLRYVDNSYDTLPTATSTTDPYTNKTTTTTIPGRHVENKTVEATIQNNMGASFYNFRYKGHYSTTWSYDPFDPKILGYFFSDAGSVPFNATLASTPTVTFNLYFLPKPLPEDGQIDIQVQALFGNFREAPYGHVIYVGGPTYDFTFNGTVSNWSDTQTVTIPTRSPSPTQTALPTLSQTSSPTPTPIAATNNSPVQTTSSVANPTPGLSATPAPSQPLQATSISPSPSSAPQNVESCMPTYIAIAVIALVVVIAAAIALRRRKQQAGSPTFMTQS